jgi:biopolymer transport protein ExbD
VLDYGYLKEISNAGVNSRGGVATRSVKINMPFIDVMLVLLIIFMVTARSS